jgi:hypothetical protein
MDWFCIILLGLVGALLHYRVKILEKLHEEELEKERQERLTRGRW